MSADDFCDIVHATIADLHVVSIKQLMQFVIAREMFVQDSEKAVGNISFDIHVERGVEPRDVALPFPFRLSRTFNVDIGHLTMVATIL